MSKRPAASLTTSNGLEVAEAGEAKRQRKEGSNYNSKGEPDAFRSMPSLADFIPWRSSEIDGHLPPLPKILDPELEKTAFTHPGASRRGESYERLEWLGDAYIELAATGLIFQTFTHTHAGRCSQLREILVRNTTLAGYFRKYGLPARAHLPPDFGKERCLGRGSSKDKDLCKTQADMFEAYFGAVIASDGENGKRNAMAWIRTLWGQTIKEHIIEYEKAQAANQPSKATTPSLGPGGADLNPKDKLRATIGVKGITIRYEDVPGNRKDKDHGLPLYTVAVYLDGWGEVNKHLGTGTAMQKKEAGQKAAAQALENKKLMRVYEGKKKAFQEALMTAQESEPAMDL